MDYLLFYQRLGIALAESSPSELGVEYAESLEELAPSFIRALEETTFPQLDLFEE